MASANFVVACIISWLLCAVPLPQIQSLSPLSYAKVKLVMEVKVRIRSVCGCGIEYELD